jgi:hypothetical protein
VSIHAGLSDGTYTEIVDGEVKEGDLAVTESIGTEEPAGARGQGGGPPGGMPRMRL